MVTELSEILVSLVGV